MHITLYRGAKNPVPARQDDFESWAEVVASLHDLASLPTSAPRNANAKQQKEQLLAWSPHRLTAPRRLAGNVEGVTMLVIDVDRCALLPLIDRLDALNISAVVYGSPSDDEAGPVDARRVRVLAPVTRSITPDESQASRYRFAEMIGLGPGQGVEGAHEAAKLFFIGRLHGTPERDWWEFSGDPVDIDALLARPLVHDWSAKAADATAASTGTSKGTGTLSRAEAVAAAWPGTVSGFGDSDTHALKLASALMPHVNGDAAAAAAIMDAHWNPNCPPDDQWSMEQLLHKAENAAEKFAELRPTPGIAAAQAKARAEFEAADPWQPTWDSWDAPDEPLDYYCAGLRLGPSAGKITLIAGQPGGAKGPILDHIAVCFAFGLPAFGAFACSRRKTLVLDFEGARLTKRRIRRMVRAVGRAPCELRGWLDVKDASVFGDINDDSFILALRSYCDTHGIDVICLDSYTSAMMRANVDYNSAQYATLAQRLGTLRRLVLAVAHANKAASKHTGQPSLVDIAYSGALASLAYTALVVHYPDEADTNLVRIGCARAPEERFDPFTVRFSGSGDEPLGVAIVPEDAAPAVVVVQANSPSIREKLAKVARNADRIERELASDARKEGLLACKLRAAVGLSGEAWADAIAECKGRGTIADVSLRCDRQPTYRIASAGASVKYTTGIMPAIGSRAGP